MVVSTMYHLYKQMKLQISIFGKIELQFLHENQAKFYSDEIIKLKVGSVVLRHLVLIRIRNSLL